MARRAVFVKPGRPLEAIALGRKLTYTLRERELESPSKGRWRRTPVLSPRVVSLPKGNEDVSLLHVEPPSRVSGPEITPDVSRNIMTSSIYATNCNYGIEGGYWRG